MSSGKKVIVNTIFIYLKLLVNFVVLLFSTRIVLDALGQEDYGIWSLVGGLVALFSVIYSGLIGSSMRYIAHSLGTGNEFLLKQNFAVSLVLHFAIGLFFILAIEIAGIFLFKFALQIPSAKVDIAWIVFHFSVLITFLFVFTVPFEAIINAHENILALSLFDILGVLLKLAVVIIIADLQNPLYYYGMLTLFVQIMLTIIKIIYCRSKYPLIKLNIIKYFNKELMKEMLSFVFWNFFGSLAWVATSQFKGILLNMFHGVIINGPNGIASNLSSQLNQVSNSLTQALNPQLVKSEGSGNRERMLKITFMATKYSLVVFIIFALPVFIELPFLLKIWLKNVPNYTVDFCRLLILYLLIEKSTFEITNAIRASGRIKSFQLVESIIQVLNIPLSYLFLKIGYSPNIVFTISVFLVVLVCVERLYFAKKLLGVNALLFLKETVVRPIGFMILAGFSALFIRSFFDQDFFGIFISSGISVGVLLLLFIRFGMDKNEHQVLLSFVSSFKKK